MTERTYRVDEVAETKSGPVLVLKSTHDTLRLALDKAEATYWRLHVRETVKLSLTLSRPSSVPPPSSSKIRG